VERVNVAVEDIPQDVVRFLAEHIESVVQLEVLLLLQSRATAAWQAPDVAAHLRISPDWTEAALAKLARGEILAVDNHQYRYAPRTPELARTIESLAAAYEDRRVSVISLIFSKPPNPIRQFTDAFRLRKEEGG
jgi:hypothetical protein